MDPQEQHQIERERYEEHSARRFSDWVDKLEGQLGMLRKDFHQFQHTDTTAAWAEMKGGLAQKAALLDAVIKRARARIEAA